MLIAGTPESSPLIASLGWGPQLAELGPEGFRIRSVRLGPHRVTVIASESEVGAVYGAFHFLRLLQSLRPIDDLDVAERPRLQYSSARPLGQPRRQHRTGVRRQVAMGLENTSRLARPTPARLCTRNASIGINGSVLNSVNARSECSPPSIWKGRRSRRRFPTIRRACVSLGPLLGANGAGWSENGRSLGSRRDHLVEGKGGRDIQAYPRLWRLPCQGKQRRAARATHLRTEPRRWRKRVGFRCGSP